MKFTLLLIENNLSDRFLIRELLNQAQNVKYELTVVSNLQEAVTQIGDHGFDAILFDLNVLESRGIQTLKKLQKYAEGMPVIVLTGTHNEHTVVKALQQGAQDYLIKGEFDSESLLRSVRHTIERGRVEKTHRESEEKFRAYVESSNDAIFLETPTGTILDCNSAACNMFGYSKEELLTLNVRDIVSQDVAETLPATYTEEDATGSMAIERENKRKDQTIFPAEVTTKIIRMSGKKYVLAYVRDITERKVAERALQESKRRFQLIAKTSQDIIFQMDINGYLTYCSPAIKTIGGYDPDAVIGMHFSEFYSQNDSEVVQEKFHKLLQGKSVELFTIKSLARGGNSVSLEVNASPILIGDNIIGVQGVARDISGRVAAQEELEKSEKKYRNLFNNLQDVYYRTDTNGKVILVSPSVYDLLGYTVEEATGMDLAQDAYVDSEDRDQFLTRLEQTGYIEGHEAQLRRKDGRIIWVSTNTRLLKNAAGEVVGVEGVTRDVTEQKKAEKALARRALLDEATAEASQHLLLSDKANINQMLGIVGSAVDVNRAYIFEFARNDKILNNTYEWCKPGTKSQIDQLQGMDTRQFRWWMEKITAGQNIVVNSLENLPDSTPEKSMLEAQNIQALLVVPVRASNGAVKGFIGFDDTEHRMWDGEEVRVLQMIAEMIGTHWERLAANHHSKIFSQLGRKLNTATTPKETADIIVEAADDLIGWDAASLDLFSPESNTITPVLSMDIIGGLKQNVPHAIQASAPSPLIQKMFEEGSQLLLRDEETDEHCDGLTLFGNVERRSASLMFVPLLHFDNPIGVLSIQSYENYAYDSGDLENLQSLAEHCAGAFERARTEQALVESERNYRQIIENMQEGLFRIDASGTILMVNSRMAEILDCDSDDILVGQNVRDFHFFQSGSHDFFLNELLEKGRVINYDNQWLTKTGRKLFVRKSAHVVSDHSGNVLYYEGTVSDITEQKETEKQLLHAQKMESMGHIAGGIAHDFNNVMATISGAEQMLSVHLESFLPQDNNPLGKYLKMIESSIERGRTVTDRMLTFTRSDIPNFQPISAMKYLCEISEIAAHTLPKNVHIEVRSYEGNDRIVGDRGQLQQILMNLCINAADAMPAGGQLTLSLRSPQKQELSTHNINPENTYLCIAVQDTGTGMDHETQRKIFDPFFTTKDPGKGTGLGLSVVYKIVQNHKGWIDVESVPGKGTAFTIGMPLVQETRENESKSNPGSTVQPGAGEKILVVDDEAAIRDLLVEVLVKNNYVVTAAENGQRALEIYEGKQEAFDLVITDLGLPELSGTELAKRIHKKRPNQCIIGSTGYIDPDEHTQLANYGFQYILQKPFQLNEVLHVVSKQIHSSLNQPAIKNN